MLIEILKTDIELYLGTPKIANKSQDDDDDKS